MVDRRFIDPPAPDPDMLLIKYNWVEAIAKKSPLVDQMSIHNWVVVSNITSMSLTEWLGLDEFVQLAVVKGVESFLKEKEKANKEAMQSLKQDIESTKSANSMFEGVRLPNI